MKIKRDIITAIISLVSAVICAAFAGCQLSIKGASVDDAYIGISTNIVNLITE